MKGTREGFRLERLEILNWGTFHNKVWALIPGCQDALLTGDIGSGKSTLVDAVCTLLLPPHKVAYNKAAGADRRERDLRSYVLGHHRRQTIEATGVTKPVALRRPGAYSVILGVFANSSLGTQVSLATVFWFSGEQEGQPDRFYAVSDRKLTVTEDFSGFGTDMKALKKRLRQDSGCELFTSYPSYGTKLRRKLGITSEQALELFHQTVSMKSVGSLDEFVREHMLEPFDTSDAISNIINHFDDLDRAHKAVVRAEEQIDALKPLLVQFDHYDRHTRNIASVERQREALRPYLASLRTVLLEQWLREQRADRKSRETRLEQERGRLKRLRDERNETERRRNQSGGQQLSALEDDLHKLGAEMEERSRRHQEFTRRLKAAGLGPVEDPAQFVERLTEIETAWEAVRASHADIDNRFADLYPQRQTLKDTAESINRELLSLRDRDTNIPSRLQKIRAALAEECGVEEGVLPFAGELIQVGETHTEWRPAAERLLGAFATSILVPDELYREASAWIERNHLRARLTYYHVTNAPPRRREAVRRNLPLMVDKLELKPSDFSEWLEAELQHRAGHECCEHLDDFRRSSKAVTCNGQIKEPGGRHTKDDSRPIDDRTRWVLGWDAKDKIDALLEDAESTQQALGQLKTVEDQLKRDRGKLSSRENTLAQLQVTEDFASLDHWSCALEIERLQERLARLRTRSGPLEELTRRLEELDKEIGSVSELEREHDRKLAVLESRIEGTEKELADERVEAEGLATADGETVTAVERLLSEKVSNIDVSTSRGRMRAGEHADKILTHAIEKANRGKNSAIANAAGMMREFLTLWREFRDEMDDKIEARGEFRKLAERLIKDDLPRHKEKFREYLRTNTIREIAAFASQLHRHADKIVDRIEVINGSLKPVEFNPGRYVQLEARPSTHLEIADFKQQLRDCTEDATGDDDERYTEEKFAQVSKVISRLRGREGYTGIDKAWRERVTDVRNWYTFLARERERDTGAEHESYTDSDGKSGGQKEKLAYTILAASLAYQYQLDNATDARRKFRFVMIDEAFGRGSEESSRFGMQLFTSLGLQLLVVTPLEKIEVIASYVDTVGFVDNPQGNYSRLQNLTIDEYREGKAAGRTRVDH
ncbi:ATP-binding protein [Nocardiopsis sp. LOL_012]|uniref:ATP-binding protein n=1 Tax=Nocardiopsis sp. LOL_012 TaxID=3345409 RepID=UPI003A8B5A4D